MDQLEQIMAILVVAILGVGVLVVFTSLFTRRRMLARGKIPDHQAREVRGALLEAVKSASTERGMWISIAPFWRGTGYTASERYFVLDPLLKQHILRPVERRDSVERFFQTCWTDILNRPTNSVVLNDKDWWKMTQGVSGIQIGTMVGGNVQQGNQNKIESYASESDGDIASRLIAALRSDSQNECPERAEELESMADSLDADLKAGRWTRVRQAIDSITAMIGSGGKAMEATAAVLQTIQ